MKKTLLEKRVDRLIFWVIPAAVLQLLGLALWTANTLLEGTPPALSAFALLFILAGALCWGVFCIRAFLILRALWRQYKKIDSTTST